MSSHDRAACLLRDGTVVAAIAEERLDRRKRSEGFYARGGESIVLPPLSAITHVLRAGEIGIADVDLFVCGRSISTCRDTFLRYLPVDPRRVVEPPVPSHHLAHAYAAYGTCPFEHPAILVIDEQGHSHPDGRFEKCSWFVEEDGRLQVVERFFGTANDLSLGMFYNVFAAVCGLGEAGLPAAGKLMGLAAHGQIHADWPRLIQVDPATGDTCISLTDILQFLLRAGVKKQPCAHYDGVRTIDEILTFLTPLSWEDPIAKDLACKAQAELEGAVVAISRVLQYRTSRRDLAYAGGVALNGPASTRLTLAGWRDVYVHPAATDDGNAIGLAYWGRIEVQGHKQVANSIAFSPFTGTEYPESEAEAAFRAFGVDDVVEELRDPAEHAALCIAGGEVVCWYQGRSEWGPRALGARSILASPTTPGIKERINTTVKYRELFRPVAVSGTREGLFHAVDLQQVPSSLQAYMLGVATVVDSRLSPVQHVDGTLRIHVVDREFHSLFYRLVCLFGELSHIAVVVNTSFNTLGEPLVETPLDAVRQFLLCNGDRLVLGRFSLRRAALGHARNQSAWQRAWEHSGLYPLRVALDLERAGYVDAGVKLMMSCGFGADDAALVGTQTEAGYYALMLRWALRKGDVQEAGKYARTILADLSLPSEISWASQAMRQSPDTRDRETGLILDAIAHRGTLLRLIEGVAGFGRDDETICTDKD